MKSDVWKHVLALLSTFCITLGLAGCDQKAEVPTPGEGPKKAAEEGSFTEVKESKESKESKETKPAEATKPVELKDDASKGEGGSNLE